MKTAVDLLLLAIALWSAHLAGAGYVLAKNSPSLRREAILRSVIAVVVGSFLVFRT